jgi:cell shape-determining protein MreD
MKNLIAFPLLVLILIVQTAVVSRLQLLSGCADLMLVVLAAWSLQEQVDSAWLWALLAGLMTAFVSGLPFFVPIVGYLFVVGFSRLLLKRVWESPLLAMFIVVFVGTLFYQLLAMGALILTGNNLPVGDVFSLIILPSVLLNMFLALPVAVMVRDLAAWVYPVAEEI